jgi:hypothetical protein
MQEAVKFEREAVRQLPRLFGELFDLQHEAPLKFQSQRGRDEGFDASADLQGRRWIFEVKSSSRSGSIAAAARQLRDAAGRLDATGVLVVPFMTPAGEKAAEEQGVNWIDLSGNASIRDGDNLYIHVRGNANRHVQRGRPSSPFAPKSARITREMLIDPARWWRQKELSEATGLDDGHVSRIVRRLGEERLLERDGPSLRPLDPMLLLDSWSDEYRFDRHDIVTGHISGEGVELVRKLARRLRKEQVEHAFTGLPAAWLLNRFAQFRLSSVFVDGDPRDVADRIALRPEERGANIQLIGPDDSGVFAGVRKIDDVNCVAPVQVYLDLQHLPERAPEAAAQLIKDGIWDAAAA